MVKQIVELGEKELGNPDLIIISLLEQVACSFRSRLGHRRPLGRSKCWQAPMEDEPPAMSRTWESREGTVYFVARLKRYGVGQMREREYTPLFDGHGPMVREAG